jgi:CDP-glucose 4,6-dehydratase
MESVEITRTMFNSVYKGKKVLVTGNTGFKGSWLTVWLNQLGAQVYGISNGVPSKPAMFEELQLDKTTSYQVIDIRNANDLTKAVISIQPDFIFHLAAQPIVGTSYADPIGTISTNAMGTVHVMDAAKSLEKNCSLILITSDKCYENVEWIYGYREIDRLGGKDIYSASKAAAEILIYSYYHSFIKHKPNLRMSSVRAGNVIGGGDWAEKRLVPDCIRAWTKNESVVIRNPASTRPWQHVLEPISGYLITGQHLAQSDKLNGEAFNFGPPSDQVFSVKEVLDAIAENWQLPSDKQWVKIEPGNFHEAGLLKLSCEKANLHLGWWPVLNFEETMTFTASWYWKYYREKGNMLEYTQQQIQDYILLATKKRLGWSIK